MRPKFHPLRVSHIRKETADCVSVAFHIPADLADAYQFQPGQYLTLRTTIHGEDIRRSYSICSGINDNECRVAIKKVDGGVFSTWANEVLKEGDELQVMMPMGNFTTAIAPNRKKNYLLFAAGSGITPVLSIAKSVLETEKQSEVTLVYGNRWFSSIIFRDLLEDMKDSYLGRFRIFHVLSAEPNEVSLFHGRIDAEKINGFCQRFIQPESIDEVFVCGPEPMIRAVKETMTAKGLSDDQIHFELFASPGQTAVKDSAKPTPKATEGKVARLSVIYDGQQVDFSMPMDGTPILDAAQRHGLDIPFSCKGGMCCTCRAHIREGKTEMKVNYALEPGEVEAGFVLTCQAHPTSETVVVDFDKQ
jgi:ring-1,2-phenylacetyl-CoA epoxidase subunit PaaE